MHILSLDDFLSIKKLHINKIDYREDKLSQLILKFDKVCVEIQNNLIAKGIQSIAICWLVAESWTFMKAEISTSQVILKSVWNLSMTMFYLLRALFKLRQFDIETNYLVFRGKRSSLISVSSYILSIFNLSMQNQ